MKLYRSVGAAFMCVALLSGLNNVAFAEADPKLWPVVKEAFFAKRDIQEVDFIKI